jgi:lipoate-protein ligase A
MMSTGKSVRKVSGGKLVRVDTSYSDARLESIKITGDFFLYPEDAILQMEELLTGMPLPLEEGRAIGMLNDVLQRNGAELIGVSTEDIVQTLQEAIQ